MKRFTALFLTLILITTILTLTGCTKRTIQTEDGAIDVSTGLGGDKVTVTSDQGTGEFGAGTELPANWPDDMPIYPGATPYGNINISGEENLETVAAVLLTNDSIDQMKSFYDKELVANGWKIESTFTADTGEGKIITYSAVKGSRMAGVVLGEDTVEEAEGNNITITISTK
ncbi:MAG: hypothetical protein QMD53_03995 [Actinomycetota bacterium]|nr:hypothetical protein [Actinomycetota bacterium]